MNFIKKLEYFNKNNNENKKDNNKNNIDTINK